MSTPGETITPSRMREPPEWQGLLGYTRVQLQTAEDPQTEVLSRACALDTEQIDHNKYYGLSLASRGLVAALRDRQSRQEIVRSGTDALLSNHNTYVYEMHIPWERQHVLFTGEINAISLAHAAGKAVESSVNLLDPAEYLLASALVCAEPDTQHGSSRYTHLRSELDRKRLEKRIEMNTFAGASRLVGEVLERTYLHQQGLDEDSERAKICVSDVTPRPSLRDKQLIRVAMQAASLHINDFVRADTAIVVDDNGIELDKSHYRPANKALQNPRQRTLGCPAKYIRDLIPLALETLEEIIDETEKTLEQQRQAMMRYKLLK